MQVQLKKFWQSLGKYLFNILISLDQLLNTLAAGDPDETISSRTGKIYSSWKSKSRKWTIAYWMYKLLDKLKKNHCEDSIEIDEGKDSLM